jgi:hypothetical protein
MTQQGYRHRIIVQDRSGSMNDILKGAQSGLEEFLKAEAAQPGRVTVSLWDFDVYTRCVASFTSPGGVLGYRIEPRGGTNMYDAVAEAVQTEGRALEGMREEDRPEDVTVLIASDGLHNTTVRNTGDQVKALLEQQQDVYKWRVIYMGCNQDALTEGAKMGTRGGLTVNSVGSDTGQLNSWRMSAEYLRRAPVAFAAAGESVFFTEEERALGESGEAQPEEDSSEQHAEGRSPQ